MLRDGKEIKLSVNGDCHNRNHEESAACASGNGRRKRLEPQDASLADLQRMIARFAPTEIRVDTSALSAGDQKALVKLIEASRIVNTIFSRNCGAAI